MAKRRLIGLDCLRGLAALLVIVVHFSSRFKGLYPDIPTFDWRFNFIQGENAVQLFFAISGFVIFMTLERTEKPIDFIKARFFRLYPTFWAAATFTFVFLLFFNLPGREVSFEHFLLNLTMIPAFFSTPGHTIPYVDGVYWTLQVEFFFYLIMVGVLLTRSKKHIDSIIIGLLCWSAIYRFLPIPSEFLDSKIKAVTLVKDIPFFALGIFVYRWKLQPEQKLKYFSLMAFALIVAMSRDGRGIIPAYVIVAALMIGASYIQTLPTFFNPLAYLGTISYSLYLVHQNFGYVIMRELGVRGVDGNLAFLLAVASSFIIASALCFGVERPTMSLYKRRYSRRSEPVIQKIPLTEKI